MAQRFLILDGSSLFFRAFFAMPPLTAPTGEYTNAIYGFSNMLVKLLEDYQPDRLAVAFDKSRHTFRTDIYPAYKGTREKTPEEFIQQVPLLSAMLKAWGIEFLELDNYEADDIIGTLATAAARDGVEALIVTGDRDALQLIRDGVNVLYTKRGTSDLVTYDEAAFKEKYGFEPIKLIDCKGLMGDSSDNIPGVPGVGEKTATKLLLEYGSLEGVYEHLDAVKGKKLKENLETYREQAFLSKRLATIDCAAPVEYSAERFAIVPDTEAMLSFCERYDLKSVRKSFLKLYGKDALQAEAVPAVAELPHEVLRTAAEAEDYLQAWKAADNRAVACLYAGKVPHVAVRGLALEAAGRTAFASAGEEAFAAVWACVAQGEAACAAYDLKRFVHAGGKLTAKEFDVELAAYLLDPEAGSYPLERLRSLYAMQLPELQEGAADEALAVWQARVLAAVAPELKAKLTELGMAELYYDIELPLIEVLAEMEHNGIFVNREELQRQSEAVGARIATLQSEIYALAETEFNLNSPKQLGEVLFERLMLPPVKKTKTGYSTNAEVLETLRFTHPIVEKILEYRVWTKLKSTYLDSLGELIDAESKRVHTSFNQLVTATGRLSSSEPNLQNIPVRTEAGRQVRRSFEPGEGFDYLLSADYSQIELRILAHLSEDESFVDAFSKGEDIHARTASEVFGVPLAELPAELRSKAKAVNFGIVYGISDYGLSRDLHISRKEAAGYIESYFAKCPGIKRFLDNTVMAAHADGLVKTMYGRRRELPAINSRNFTQRSLAERMAMNTPIQGTAADVIKLAMIRAYRALKAAGLKSRILLQVHDELLLEVPRDELEQVVALLQEAMEKAVELKVPLKVDVHWGSCWAEAK